MNNQKLTPSPILTLKLTQKVDGKKPRITNHGQHKSFD